MRGERDRAKVEALEAAEVFLIPFVDLLLKLGVSAGDFSALGKTVYVHRAAHQLRSTSGRGSISRIAIVTGLTRAEVTKLINSPAQRAVTRTYERHRADRVIHGWRTDLEFSRPGGRPRSLPLRGHAASFASLVKKYSGDIPQRAMLDQLIASGLVTRGRDGTIRLSRGFSAQTSLTAGSIRTLGEQAGNFLTTLVKNLEGADKWYVGTASANQQDEKLLTVLRERLARDGQNFLGTVAEQLENPPRQTPRKALAKPVRLGLTLFVFEAGQSPKLARSGRTHRRARAEA